MNRLGWTALHEAIILGKGTATYDDTVRSLWPVAPTSTPQAGRRRAARARAKQGVCASGRHLEKALRQDAAGPVDQAEANRRLLAAATDGDPDAAALALRAGADWRRPVTAGYSLLLAATNDRTDVARVLVALGANPNALDDQHDTPWLVTGVTGSVPMLEALLPAHPDLSIRNRFGGVSVIPASERGHVDYVRRVVTTGIDVNHVSDLGWTAMLEAVILGDGGQRHRGDRADPAGRRGEPVDRRQGRHDAAAARAARGHRELAAILSA